MAQGMGFKAEKDKLKNLLSARQKPGKLVAQL